MRHAVEIVVEIPGVADDRVGNAGSLDGVLGAEVVRRESDDLSGEGIEV
jgi:hypothetical protein